MTVLEPTRPLFETWPEGASTGPAMDNVLESTSACQGRRQAWQSIIDNRLIGWANDPAALEDDGLEAPSRQVIDLACALCYAAMRAETQPPDRVVPDGDGGLSMEWKLGPNDSVTVDILPDCTVERIEWSKGQVMVQTL